MERVGVSERRADAHDADTPAPMTTDATRSLKGVHWGDELGIRHIAIIPDGNRRWAADRSLPPMAGHSVGLLKVLPRIVRELSAAGVHTLTAWGFSTENWKRQGVEVEHLMTIFAEFLQKQMMGLAIEQDARLIHLGRKDRMPTRVVDLIADVEAKTAHHKSHVYNVALDYGGEDEMRRAVQRMADASVASGRTDLSITEFLDTAGQLHPEPDVLVRSSGETRLSGFLPLQSAYSELFFVDRHFPEFNMELFEQIAQEFVQRKRRFGS